MSKVKLFFNGIKTLLVKHKSLVLYSIASLVVAYLFSSQRKIYIKHDLEVNLELYAPQDGVKIDTNCLDTLQ